MTLKDDYWLTYVSLASLTYLGSSTFTINRNYNLLRLNLPSLSETDGTGVISICDSASSFKIPATVKSVLYPGRSCTMGTGDGRTTCGSGVVSCSSL
jgi:hypothetical protein